MLKLSLTFVLAAALVANAQVSVWGQCGGINYSGQTNCTSGNYCNKLNDYYHQCIPGAGSSSSTSIKPTSTATPTSTPPTSTSTTSTPIPTSTASGVVTTSGTEFRLNGKKFYFVGSNAYWLPMLTSTADVDKALDDFAASGMKVLRIWGFADLATNDGTTTTFQTWTNGKPTINTNGANGLKRLDYCVEAARKRGIRLVIPLVNNWNDYGGVQRYVQSQGLSNHDAFFTSATLKQYYKDYVRAVISRYAKDDPAIFAWQIANEIRCKGNLPATACTPALLTSWVSEMAAYIKSLDSTHLLSVGDEGFFNRAGASEWEYKGGEGVDNEAYLKLPTVDYGTFHLYVSAWSKTYDWGTQWIKDHADVADKVGKPMVFEEYGITRSTGQRLSVVRTWHDAVLESSIAGDMYWQFGAVLPNAGRTHDDTNTIYTDDAEYKELVVEYVKRMEAKNK